jgi:hypothetical protein
MANQFSTGCATAHRGEYVVLRMKMLKLLNRSDLYIYKICVSRGLRMGAFVPEAVAVSTLVLIGNGGNLTPL